MAGYVEGVDRGRTTLFPDRLDDFVNADNPVRAVNAFVDALDLRELGLSTRLTFASSAFVGCTGMDRQAGLPPGGNFEALRLRLPQPDRLQPQARARAGASRPARPLNLVRALFHVPRADTPARPYGPES